ncbi:thiamine-phosphate kinase [Waterburya agarophytonicola K14]|uniref:Thiamine-monophosphate kinase n=1 Tax=Waterburya agarophytonicola KI4 TaxID=2874699 RepID=A0A964FHM0_9CYAN|nr:thiamine-phosphate kinase [Waterburya agarophytonicola]MCC0177613.1 thiamine-phosphate kinase [Waterburya agarophytonicola KI4]
MGDKSLLVKDLGERGLLERLQRYCPVDVVGDDGAILTTDPHKSLVVTTDVLVDGVHFSDRTTSPYDVGWRATAANLSDLAAMGATPLGITVGLSLPGDKEVDWVEEIYRGIDGCLNLYPTPLVGGDICRSTVTTIAITAFGEVSPQKALLRSSARPGDAILVTGLHGLSRGGLELLLHPNQENNLEPIEFQRLIKAHQRPLPRLDVLPYLTQIPDSIAIAGMDSSDGLADAVIQICENSNVGAIINLTNLKVFSGLIKLVGLEQAQEYLLYGGEDFELVLCLPQNHALLLVEKLGNDAKIIGKITDGKEIKIALQESPDLEKTLNINKGFRHF